MAYRVEITSPSIAGGTRSLCIPIADRPWPVPGWTLFEFLSSPEFQATRHDPGLSSILGLGYSVHYCRTCANDTPPDQMSAVDGCATCRDTVLLRIDSWLYDLAGASSDLPIMEMLFDGAHMGRPATALLDLKIMARPVQITEKIASRAVNAALFFLHQIQAECVPDYERILELHRLHPDLRQTKKKLVTPSRKMHGANDYKNRAAQQGRTIGPGAGFGRIYDAGKNIKTIKIETGNRPTFGSTGSDDGQ